MIVILGINCLVTVCSDSVVIGSMSSVKITSVKLDWFVMSMALMVVLLSVSACMGVGLLSSFASVVFLFLRLGMSALGVDGTLAFFFSSSSSLPFSPLASLLVSVVVLALRVLAMDVLLLAVALEEVLFSLGGMGSVDEVARVVRN